MCEYSEHYAAISWSPLPNIRRKWSVDKNDGVDGVDGTLDAYFSSYWEVNAKALKDSSVRTFLHFPFIGAYMHRD